MGQMLTGTTWVPVCDVTSVKVGRARTVDAF